MNIRVLRSAAVGALPVVLALVAGVARAGAPPAAAALDAQTRLLLHFDGNLAAEGTERDAQVTGSGIPIGDGRAGGALRLPEGARLAVTAEGSLLPASQGSIELWLRTPWSGAPGQRHDVFGAAGNATNYVNLNLLDSGRFGAAFSSQAAGGSQQWKRVDAPIPAWVPGEWHAVALTWRGGHAALWIDGVQVAEADGIVFPVQALHTLVFSGSGYDVDELRISDVARDPAASAPAAGGSAAAAPASSQRSDADGYHDTPGAYAWRGAPPSDPAGMALGSQAPFAELDPRGPLNTSTISIAAARGEREVAAAILVAARAQPDLDVRMGPLVGPGGTRLPADAIELRRVVRSPMRRVYSGPPGDVVTTDRFLAPLAPVSFGAGEFRELWITLQVPADAKAGEYRGELVARSGDRSVSLPIAVRVRPFALDEPTSKQHGIYYQLAQKLADAGRVQRELADQQAHGVRNLVTDLGIQYLGAGESWKPDASLLRRGLSAIRQAGYRGTIVIGTGLDRFARSRGHRDTTRPEELASDEVFQATAVRGVELLNQVQADFPDLHLAVTHLDEIFSKPGNEGLYIALSRLVRAHSKLPLYITISTSRPEQDAARARIDSYVDIRSQHGYSFETWLLRGHTMSEYEAELARSGDVAWLYHNQRGPWFTAEWSRIINGIYLWASPFAVHAPWAYQSIQGDPYDEQDGPEADTVMSLPALGDPTTLVPTRVWEGFRDGYEDLRYLTTLERLIADRGAARPEAARAARRDLDRLRALVRAEKPAGEQATAAGGALDLDTPLSVGPQRGLSPAEAPWIEALAERFPPEAWTSLRELLSKHIEALSAP